MGVGDATASTTAAVLLSILQDSLGRVTTILFAARFGTSLEPECKMYRLLADIFNDTAMVLECLSPAFPKPIRVSILATSSALKALCGVAAGSSKASLSAHFARWGNLGELNAKDSSQETVISLLGMLAGSLVVSWITSPEATWATLMILLSNHLAMNYRAVRAVSMRTLNRQRANIVFGRLVSTGKILTPKEVSQQERVFDYDGLVRDVSDKQLGHCEIGVSTRDMLRMIGGTSVLASGSLLVKNDVLKRLLELYQGQPYILCLDRTTKRIYIALKKDCTALNQLRAWYTAFCALHMLSQQDVTEGLTVPARDHGLKATNDEVQPLATRQDKVDNSFPGKEQLPMRDLGSKATNHEVRLLTSVQDKVDNTFHQIEQRLREAGWDLETAALQTFQTSRIIVEGS